jgi:hypothetical protein
LAQVPKKKISRRETIKSANLHRTFRIITDVCAQTAGQGSDSGLLAKHFCHGGHILVLNTLVELNVSTKQIETTQLSHEEKGVFACADES